MDVESLAILESSTSKTWLAVGIVPETLRRDAIRTVVTQSRDGGRRGFAIGLTVDLVVVAFLIVGLSHLEMPPD